MSLSKGISNHLEKGMAAVMGGVICAGFGAAATANPVFCTFKEECSDQTCRPIYDRAVLFDPQNGRFDLFWQPYETPVKLTRTSKPDAEMHMYAGNVPGFFFYTVPDGSVVMSDRMSATAFRTDYKGHCGRRFD